MITFDFSLVDLVSCEEEIPKTEKDPGIKISEGAKCNKCKDFVLMAQSNQEDGTFICYLCRKDPWR